MKNERQEKILEIIASEPIETQKQLVERLRASGCAGTQATVSRDIKQLHLVKEPFGGGRYRYAVAPSVSSDHLRRLQTILRESLTSVDCAQNIVVLKTIPGLANGAASAFDERTVPGMVGSLAGDDTVIIVMRDDAAALALCSEIAGMQED